MEIRQFNMLQLRFVQLNIQFTSFTEDLHVRYKNDPYLARTLSVRDLCFGRGVCPSRVKSRKLSECASLLLRSVSVAACC